MATFEEKKREITERYAAAAQTQNHRLFRDVLVDHWELLREGDGPADELITALTSNGRRILGKQIDSVTVDELVDLVSSVREDMTESQRLSVFMQELLASNGRVPARPQARRPAVAAPRFGRPLPSTRADYDDDFDYPDVDFTPNRSIGAAAQGIIAVVVLLALLGGLLYLLNQL
jgi:hypothetical protein